MDLGRRGRGKGLLVLEGGGGRSSGRGLSLPLLFRSLLELLLLLLLLISSLSSSSSDKELRGVLAGPAPLALDRRRRSGEEQGRGLVHLFFLSLGQEGGAPFSLGREEVKKKASAFFFPHFLFLFQSLLLVPLSNALFSRALLDASHSPGRGGASERSCLLQQQRRRAALSRSARRAGEWQASTALASVDAAGVCICRRRRFFFFFSSSSVRLGPHRGGHRRPRLAESRGQCRARGVCDALQVSVCVCERESASEVFLAFQMLLYFRRLVFLSLSFDLSKTKEKTQPPPLLSSSPSHQTRRVSGRPVVEIAHMELAR